MRTLEDQLAELDKQIAYQREQRDATMSEPEKAKWQRLIDRLDIHERAAIKRNHAERVEQQAKEAQAQQAAQQARADKQEAEIRRTLRLRLPHVTDAEFDRLYPQMRDQYLVDKALGRQEPNALPFGSRVEF